MVFVAVAVPREFDRHAGSGLCCAHLPLPTAACRTCDRSKYPGNVGMKKKKQNNIDIFQLECIVGFIACVNAKFYICSNS